MLVYSALSVALASPGFNVRLAARSDVVPLALLVERSFAAAGRTECLADGEATYANTRRRSFFEQKETTFRVGLDIERRLTPWDWSRHAQVVAESPNGEILGFCEVWGEDAASLGNVSALTPQPVIFNLCVASEARRRGVAQALLDRCEETAAGWGDSELYLKVRRDNGAAVSLYEEGGWETLETRARSELPAWQERWKGGTMPLKLMRKPLPSAPPAVASPLEELASSTPARSFDEFEVNINRVLQYEDREAIIWFVLLVLRNRESLTPTYRVLPGVAAIATWALYYLVIRALSHPEQFPMLTGLFE